MMTQTNTRDFVGHTSTNATFTQATSGAGSFALVMLMPVSFVLTILTIVMLRQ